jgi:hypothetical protein
MKKHNIIIALLLIYFKSNAQENKTVTTTKEKLYVGIQFEKSNENQLIKTTPPPDDQFPILVNNVYPAKKSGYKIGIPILYYIKPKLAFNSGVFLKKRVFETDKSQFVDDRTGFVIADTIEWYSAQSNFIDVPVGINYYFFKRKVSMFGSTSIINSIKLHNKYIHYVSENGTIKKETVSNNTTYLSYMLGISQGIGIDVDFGRFKVRVNPELNVFTTPFSKNRYTLAKIATTDKYYYTDFNLNLGIYYSLK